jgi:aspartyl-tRNA(Asn)/glutamyl-tRNA(Gln) amidotransferase subunit A
VSDDLCFATVADLVRLYAAREVSPVDVVEAVLDRIDRLDPVLNAYARVLGDSARDAARAAERRLRDEATAPPLCGIPLSVKDNIATAGIRTTAGSRILRDWVPAEDAACVTALRDAGAVLVGKTNLFEFAYGEAHEDYGHVRNPWNLDRSTAGSSTGSVAAVAAGLGQASIGTDTGGSIRVPAAMCGVAGLKPTFGRIAPSGLVSTTHTLCHIGPIARTVEDVATVFSVLAADDVTGAVAQGVAGVRVGVAEAARDEVIAAEVRAAVDEAAAELGRQGAQLVTIEPPDLALARAVLWAIASAEAAEIHHERLAAHADDYGPVVRARLDRGELVPATAYVRAQRVRRRLMAEVDSILERVDVLLLPVSPITAYPLGARVADVDGRPEEVSQAVTRYTPLASVAGRPALAVPCGFSSDGLPIGFQLVARAGDEASLVRVGCAYERATEWHRQRPMVAASDAVAAESS